MSGKRITLYRARLLPPPGIAKKNFGGFFFSPTFKGNLLWALSGDLNKQYKERLFIYRYKADPQIGPVYIRLWQANKAVAEKYPTLGEAIKDAIEIDRELVRRYFPLPAPVFPYVERLELVLPPDYKTFKRLRLDKVIAGTQPSKVIENELRSYELKKLTDRRLQDLESLAYDFVDDVDPIRW